MAATPYNIIRYEGGDNNVIIYKSEITDFSNESVLIVDQSQQALLYKDGQAEGPFLSGRHVLPTNNLPKFRSFFAKLFSRRKDNREDGSTPFTCDVFFVNMVNDVSVHWGTPTRMMVKDPVYNECVNVGANGSVKVKVSDAMRFVVSMAGQSKEYSMERIAATVRSDILVVLKTHLASMIVESKVSLLEIQTKLLELSAAIERKLNDKLLDYGLCVLHFNIEDISVDEASQGRLLARQSKINARSDIVLDSDAQTTADYNRTVRMAEAKAKEREVQGYTYHDEQYWQTQQKIAEHPAPKAPSNPFAGSPYPGYPYPGYPYPNAPYPGAVPPVPPINPYYGQQAYPGAQQAAICPNCRNPLPAGAAFCSVCGSPVQTQQAQQPQQTYQYSQTAQAAACPKCGFPVTPRAARCPNCNCDLTGESNEE